MPVFVPFFFHFHYPCTYRFSFTRCHLKWTPSRREVETSLRVRRPLWLRQKTVSRSSLNPTCQVKSAARWRLKRGRLYKSFSADTKRKTLAQSKSSKRATSIPNRISNLRTGTAITSCDKRIQQREATTPHCVLYFSHTRNRCQINSERCTTLPTQGQHNAFDGVRYCKQL